MTAETAVEEAGHPQQVEEEDAVLVGRLLALRAGPPLLDQALPVKDAEGDGGVADIDGQEHGWLRPV